jgi:hypothetical protein
MSSGPSVNTTGLWRIPLLLECFFFSAVALLYVMACLHFPLSLFCHQVFDDALFVKLAQSIASGQWLGDYNELTLVKGPFFPLFLAINHFFGLPVTLSLALVYALSCWLFVYSLRSIGVPFVLGMVLYILLLFQPALFPTRVIRDNLYASISLVVLATGVLLISKKAPYWNAVFCGLALAAFFLTREEGIWIFPGLLVLVAGTWFLSRKGFYREWSRAKGNRDEVLDARKVDSLGKAPKPWTATTVDGSDTDRQALRSALHFVSLAVGILLIFFFVQTFGMATSLPYHTSNLLF